MLEIFIQLKNIQKLLAAQIHIIAMIEMAMSSSTNVNQLFLIFIYFFNERTFETKKTMITRMIKIMILPALSKNIAQIQNRNDSEYTRFRINESEKPKFLNLK